MAADSAWISRGFGVDLAWISRGFGVDSVWIRVDSRGFRVGSAAGGAARLWESEQGAWILPPPMQPFIILKGEKGSQARAGPPNPALEF